MTGPAQQEREAIVRWHKRQAQWMRDQSGDPAVEMLARIHDESAKYIERGAHIEDGGHE